MAIKNIPDGWEFAGVGKVKRGEFYLSEEGRAHEWTASAESGFVNYVIIHKVEKPKRYRPFKDTVEYMPHHGRPIRRRGGRGFDVIVSAADFTLFVANGDKIIEVDLQQAFDNWEFVDGTPFGVEVTE